ncbi:unnamed protein product [Cuscuta campestris]|uniref:WRKY domain-containing protein n=1 Tax=Cuscuta campestris TaxID=132261 RepID=A0A484MIJ1_9ASTE|nr:unnamed protein product [Cuscuta campestris]
MSSSGGSLNGWGGVDSGHHHIHHHQNTYSSSPFTWGGFDHHHSDGIIIPKLSVRSSPAPAAASMTLSLPSPASPSSFLTFPPLFSPSLLLDSPHFFPASNVLPSPTTGAFGGLNKSSPSNEKEEEEERIRKSNDFSFQITSSWEDQQMSRQQPIIESVDLSSTKAPKPMQPQARNMVLSSLQENAVSPLQKPVTVVRYNQPSQNTRAQKAEDGYRWRKYGQKQVKGSQNPRSYYKCTYANCPTKKKVERNSEGHITEIVYKGSHNHAKPQSTKRFSSSNVKSESFDVDIANHQPNVALLGSTHPRDNGFIMPENSSVSFGDDDLDQGSVSRDDGDSEPVAKRWKGDNDNEALSSASRTTVREPRIVVQTTSEIDILDDGYRWKKYGQKVVKENPNPRSYYKCTYTGCQVRKHVERACHDRRAVITTYEGKHNHDVPAGRGGDAHAINKPQTRTVSLALRPPTMPADNSDHSLNNQNASRQQPITLQMLQGPDLGSAENSEGYYMDEPKDDDDFFTSFLN